MGTKGIQTTGSDAYDSDVDEGPHASAAFMANISSTGGTNGLSSSHNNEEEHLNSKVDSVLDDNMITYDEYQNDSGVEAVPTVALEHNKVKHDLDMAIVERNKRNAELEEENVMLKSTLKSKVVSIENLQQESKQVIAILALFDEFERFRANGNELIQDYFVRSHKLVNDMKVTQLDIPTHQLNTKFANNFPSYWGKKALSNTGTKGIQTTGSGVNNLGKKVICYNCRGEGHVARQCKEPKRARDSQWYHDKSLLMQAKEKGVVDVSYPLAQEMQQEEHLNSEVDSVLDDNMFTYDEYQNDSRVKAVPTVVSADEADKQSMIAVLQRMRTKIAGYVRVSDKHKLVNATLTAELERCKIEMHALKRNKVKHDLDMAIVERNKRNAELEEENVMLKSILKSKVVSIENLQQESKQGLSKKKTLEDKYLEEIVVLTNANKVATNVLKGF
nr:hypothetical protein [Tanacetum cinerariifolium]